MVAEIHWLQAADIQPIAAAFAALGWDKPASQYERYLAEQQAGKRVVLVAELAGIFAGYLTIVWQSHYQPFRWAGIPEIVDFNVLPQCRRQRIGTQLMDAAEHLIAARAPVAGIGVGLTADYAAAHLLYLRRGYLPDGRGIAHAGRPLQYGETITLNDDQALYFTKQVR
jgi:GNAT superfamily N-acetyltransferase